MFVGPLGHERQVVFDGARVRVAVAKKIALPAVAILALLRAVAHGVFQRGEQRGAARSFMQAVERAGFDQTFHAALVGVARVNTRAKIEQARERAVLRAILDDRLDRFFADALDRAERKAQQFVVLDAEMHAGFVDVRREHVQPDAPRFVDVLDDLVGLALFERHVSGHEFSGVIGFQIRRLIRHERIRGGVRFVKTVFGELRDQRVKLHGFLTLDAIRRAAVGELNAVLVHQIFFLLAHRLAQTVCIAEREIRDLIGDLHDLFLIHDDAVRVFQDRGELRHVVFDFFAAMLARAETGDVAHRAGAVHGVERGQILETIRARVNQQAAHAFGFKLKHRARITAAEHPESFRVVERQFVEIDHAFARQRFLDARAAAFLDELARDRQFRQRFKSEKIDLQQAHVVEVRHFVLRQQHAVFVAVERAVFGHGPVGDDQSGGVAAGVARDAFAFARKVDEFLHVRVGLVQLFEFRHVVDGVLRVVVLGARRGRGFERDFFSGQHGDQLGDVVDFGEFAVEHASDVADRSLGQHGVEGDDVGGAFAAIFVLHVIDDFSAPALAEIDVDVGHLIAAFVHEALEDQAVFERVEIGDAERVTGDRTGGAAAAGADGDAARAGFADDVPDDQQVFDEIHFRQHAQFFLRARNHAVARRRAIALADAVHDLAFEINVHVFVVGDFVFRKMIFAEFDLEVAALGDFERVRQRLRNTAEQARHLLAALQVKLIAGEFHAMRVLDRLAHADAQQRVVGFGVVTVGVVAVVGADDFAAQLFRHFEDRVVDGLLHGPEFAHVVGRFGRQFAADAMVLNFKIKIFAAENFLVRAGHFVSRAVILVQHGLRHFAAHAARRGDDALAVLREQFAVHARVVVKALLIGVRGELHQVAVALFVGGPQQHVVVDVAVDFFALGAAFPIGHNVRFHADDRLERREAVFLGEFVRLLAGLVEFDRSEHVAVVGDGQCGLLHLARALDQIADARRAVEQAVLGVGVQVAERHFDFRFQIFLRFQIERNTAVLIDFGGLNAISFKWDSKRVM